MRNVLIAVAFCAFAFPCAAAAAEGSCAVESAYVFEKQAFVASGKPVVNCGASFDLGNGFTADPWAQGGEDKISEELDLVGGWHRDFGTVTVHAVGGGYFYPTSNFETIYTVGGGVSTSVHGVIVDASVQQYWRGYKTTQWGLSGTRQFSVGDDKNLSLTLGIGRNTANHSTPVFGAISYPLTARLDLFGHGFVDHGSGGSFGLRAHF